MNVDVRSPRGTATVPDLAAIAAIVCALYATRALRPTARPQRNGAGTRWRTAGRSYAAYDLERAVARAKRPT